MEEIKGLGHKEACLVLSTIANNETADMGYRVTAAAALAPYQHPKLQSIPTPRYIELQIDVPDFTSVNVAEEFVARIAVLVARGHLDIQSGQELIGLAKVYIDAQYAKEELQFKISPPETRDQTIRIVGGLDPLPGTNVTMPVVNGHVVREQLLSAPTDVIPPDIEPLKSGSTPGEAKAEGPHPLQPHHFASEPAEGGGQNSNGQGPETQGGNPV
jgi:hypothetical protein